MRLSSPRALIENLPKDNAEVGDAAAPGWIVGRGGIEVEQLVLVSIKRASTGTWTPRVRFTDSQELVTSHELGLFFS